VAAVLLLHPAEIRVADANFDLLQPIRP
jgi:hypothetical protein